MKYAVAIAAAMLGLAGPAGAAVYSFTLTGSYNASWLMDSSPVPDPDFGTTVRFNDVSGTFPGTAANLADLYFYPANNGGGLLIRNPLDDAVLANGFGAQLFSGSHVAPTFLTGSFSLASVGGTPGAYTLVVADTAGAVPEPAGWAMMIAGFGLVGGSLRAARVRVAYAA